MTAEPIQVRTVDGHVEVSGVDQATVEAALQLQRSVSEARLGARAGIEALTHQALLASAEPLVSLASQRQVQRVAVVRDRLLHEEGYETYESLGTLRGTTASAARTWVARQRGGDRLFTVEVRGRTCIPSVQLLDGGSLDEHVSALVTTLLDAGLDGWGLWAWLTTPSSRLSGEVPAVVARSDPQRAALAARRHGADVNQHRDQLEPGRSRGAVT